MLHELILQEITGSRILGYLMIKETVSGPYHEEKWLVSEDDIIWLCLAWLARPDGTLSTITKRVVTKASGWTVGSVGGAARAGILWLFCVVKEKETRWMPSTKVIYLFAYKRAGEELRYFVDVYRFIMDIDENDLHLQTKRQTRSYVVILFRSENLQQMENFCIMTV